MRTLPKKERSIWIAIVTCVIFSVLSCWQTAVAQTKLVKPDQWLAAQIKPVFAPDSRLIPLTWWAWPLSSNVNIELAKNWGYALDLCGDFPWLLQQLTNKNTTMYKYVSLAKENPQKYKLSIKLPRFWSFNVPPGLTIPDGVWVTNEAGYFIDKSSNTWSSITNKKYTATVSPESPDSFWINFAEYVAGPLRVINSNAPISVILDGGEYGLGVTGNEADVWKYDPRVIQSKSTSGMGWNLYSSIQKSRQMSFLSKAIASAVPERKCYVYYSTGNEQNRYYFNWITNWSGSWGWSSDVFTKNFDMPSFENYYQGPYCWTNAPGAQWNKVADLLTKQLNGVGYNLKLGYKTNYSWVCGGWGSNLSDITCYTGFLKCLYTSGMIGGIAGYFDYPVGGFDVAFDSNSPPHWLLQIQAISQVQALFSRLDAFLFEGDLLPGPNKHVWATDQSAYEFPTGNLNVRVLVRKMSASDKWLITAWAADGIDRGVSVTIPDLGSVSVNARTCGSVYIATRNSLQLVDTAGLYPSNLGAAANLRFSDE